MDGIDENDNEFVQLSNFEHFIDMLNVFVARKGMIKKQFDTPVRVYQSYLKNIAVTAVDKTLSDKYNQFEQKLQRECRYEFCTQSNFQNFNCTKKYIT